MDNNNNNNDKPREWVLLMEALKVAEEKSAVTHERLAGAETETTNQLLEGFYLGKVSESAKLFIEKLGPFASEYGILTEGSIARFGDELLEKNNQDEGELIDDNHTQIESD